MAFADVTDGSRVIQGTGPAIQLAITTTVNPGDLLTETGGRADANAATPAPATYVTGTRGVNGDTIPVYREAIISGVSGATKGNKVFLSDTAGGYSETASTTQRQEVGFSIAATAMYVRPARDVQRFGVGSGVIDATYDQDRYFFVASERVRVVAIEEINSAIENTSATTTVMVEKHLDAQAIGHANEKSVLAAALNLKTGCTANTRQSLALTPTAADLVLEKGHALALNFTNAVTEYVGNIAVWLEPA